MRTWRRDELAIPLCSDALTVFSWLTTSFLKLNEVQLPAGATFNSDAVPIFHKLLQALDCIEMGGICKKAGGDKDLKNGMVSCCQCLGAIEMSSMAY